MKHDFETLLKKSLSGDELSSQEREKMRFVVSEYMSFTPRRTAARRAGMHALFASILSYARRPTFARITAALLVLAFSSGGVAYAAEGTLPGDALYPVKVNVIEPAEGLLLAGSPRA